MSQRPKRSQRPSSRYNDLEDSDADEQIQRATKRRPSGGTTKHVLKFKIDLRLLLNFIP
jgi:hypothetical protein